MHKQLISKLYEIGAVKFGEFTLKSGLLSPIYIDLRVTISYPEVLKMVASAMWEKVHELNFDLICGVPYTALPIATVISIEHNIPMVMRRKEIKEYGTKKIIEGHFETGQSCLVVEDLVTSGSSVFETIEPLEHASLKVQDIIVLVDREQGGKKHISKKGYRLHSVFTISEMLEILHRQNKLGFEMVEKVKNFVISNQL